MNGYTWKKSTQAHTTSALNESEYGAVLIYYPKDECFFIESVGYENANEEFFWIELESITKPNEDQRENQAAS